MDNAQVPSAQIKTNLSAWAAAAAGWAKSGSGVDVALYINDKIPAPGDAASDYTPCTITGASAAPTLVADAYTFTDGTVAVAVPTLATYTPLVEPDPAVTAYGWFAKNHTTGTLVAAARFTDPIQLHLGVTLSFQVAVSGPLNWKFPNPVTP